METQEASAASLIPAIKKQYGAQPVEKSKESQSDGVRCRSVSCSFSTQRVSLSDVGEGVYCRRVSVCACVCAPVAVLNTLTAALVLI